MTTKVQIRKLLRPVLERDPSLALIGQWLIVRPVRHVVRAVLVDRTGEADRFRLSWAVMHLFQVRRSIFLNWGDRIYPTEKGHLLWSDPSITTRVPTVITPAVEALKRIETIDDLWLHLAAYYRKHGITDKPPLYDWPDKKLIFDVAMGRLNEARTPCADWVSRLKGETYFRGDSDDHADVARLKELCRRYEAGDVEGLAALLHEWEHTTVRNLEIEHLWEPTPFPLETEPTR